MEFMEWVCNEKNYSERAARDVKSRLTRAKKYTKKNINTKTIDILETNNDFCKLSVSVKSQIRKSVRLFLEYQGVE